MKQISRILSIAALLFVGAMTLGCTRMEIPDQVGNDGIPVGNDETQCETVTMTTTIGLDSGSDTKALSAAGVKTFAPGDRIAVFYVGDGVRRALSEPLSAGNISDEGKKASFTVTLTNPLADAPVRYIYPAEMSLTKYDYDEVIDDANTIDFGRLNSQEGSLTSLAGNLDLAVYDGYLSASKELPSSVTLHNRLCIGKFNIKNGSGTNINDKLVRLTVSDGTNSYSVNRSASADPFYIAMLPVNNKTVSISATDGQDYYSKQVNSVSLDRNKIYPINVTVAETDDRETPLTFVAVADGTTVRFNTSSPSVSVQYKHGSGVWGNYVIPIIMKAGETLSFRGNNASYEGCSFTLSGDCYIYGNIMSLVNATGFATATTLTAESAFSYLFYGNTHILSHPSKPLLLPATVLTEACYMGMFMDCEGLTTAPALPATTLAEGCYANMFMRCPSLTSAPALPATTLTDDCYFSMFRGCTSLSTAPELPAVVVTRSCYSSMFHDCSSLSMAPALPATTLAEDCYMDMFNGCSSLGVAPSLPATELAEACYSWMFGSCTSLYVAPELPATTLANNCYESMFNSCRSLTTAPALPATILAEYCYQNMFNLCLSLKEAPALPATGDGLRKGCYSGMFIDCDLLTTSPLLPALTLVEDCYDEMFQDCDNLNSVTCLAVDNFYGNTDNWLEGVPATGTFITWSYVFDQWPSGPSGIPIGWNGIPY